MNPSLWRLAQLNAINGLFTVVDGMYQVRGFSLANMTILEGRTGLISSTRCRRSISEGGDGAVLCTSSRGNRSSP